MKNKLSIITATILLGSSALEASSFDLADALESGTLGGDIGIYGEYQDKKEEKDARFSMGSLGLTYESAKFHNFGLSLGFRANGKIEEKEDGDYDNENAPSVLLHSANISYEVEFGSLAVGRQELDLEWATDFHEAIVGVFTPLTDLTITAGHSRKVGEASEDEPLVKFDKFNGNDGAQFLDVAYSGVNNMLLKAYAYNANDIATWYGAKVEWDSEVLGFTLHGAKSDEKEDKKGAEHNGHIYHIEARGAYADFALNGGYVTTSKNGGIGSMETMGESINPLDEGDKVYEHDARTYYIGLGYEFGDLSLGVLCGNTKYKDDDMKKREKEINFSADYTFSENLTIGALVTKIDAHENENDYTKFALSATYSF
ncbi:MAG: Opr family porin [Campylobacteraceae bacterium]|nr:Opr family porin [Campylobacteraceae bacterium]